MVSGNRHPFSAPAPARSGCHVRGATFGVPCFTDHPLPIWLRCRIAAGGSCCIQQFRLITNESAENIGDDKLAKTKLNDSETR